MERYFDRIANDALVMEKWKRVEELKETIWREVR